MVRTLFDHPAADFIRFTERIMGQCKYLGFIAPCLTDNIIIAPVDDDCIVVNDRYSGELTHGQIVFSDH